MAYVPPHKRTTVDLGNPPSPSSSPTPRDLTTSLGILWSPHSVRRFLVVDPHSNTSPALLEFQPYQGEHGHSHLKNIPLYTLREVAAAASSPSAVQGCSNLETPPPKEVSPSPASPDCSCSEAVVQSLVESLRHDLVLVIARFLEAPAQSIGHFVPDIYLQFGRIFFSSPTVDSGRGSFNWTGNYTSLSLEQHFGRRRMLKTFHNYMTSDSYTQLWERVRRQHPCQTRMKHQYFLMITDRSRPGAYLLCDCCMSAEGASDHGTGSTKTIPAEDSQGAQQLRVRKVRVTSPVRHLVADMACPSEIRDLRLMLWVKEYLNEEDVRAVEAWARDALVADEEDEGSRFKLVTAFHSASCSFREGGVKWKLRRSPMGGQMELKLKVLKELLKRHEECNSQVVAASLSEILEGAWKFLEDVEV